MNFNKITGCGEPINNFDVVNKKYVDNLFLNTLGKLKFHDVVIDFGTILYANMDEKVLKVKDDLITINSNIFFIKGIMFENDKHIDLENVKEVKLNIHKENDFTKISIDFPGGYQSLAKKGILLKIRLIYFTF